MSDAQEMFFFIADISGYTNYMVKNQTDYTHGTLIITKLLKSLVEKIQIPMKISKLEGDAIFLYFLKDQKPEPALLGEKILLFFEVFLSKLKDLANSTDCPCGACSNIEKLNLKIVGHLGKATIDRIGNFEELSGVDVILAHRLLKNQVPAHRYLLLTEPAYREVSLPAEGKIEERTEQDKDLGTIPVFVYYPPNADAPVLEDVKPSGFTLAKTHFSLFMGTWLLKHNLMKIPPFRNLPEP